VEQAQNLNHLIARYQVNTTDAVVRTIAPSRRTGSEPRLRVAR